MTRLIDTMDKHKLADYIDRQGYLPWTVPNPHQVYLELEREGLIERNPWGGHWQKRKAVPA